MSHTVYAFIHIPFLTSVHCKDSLASFEPSSCCYTINTGPSIGLLLDILLLLCVLEVLQLLVCRTGPFTCSSRSCWSGPTQNPSSRTGLVIPPALPAPHGQCKLSGISRTSSLLAAVSKCMYSLLLSCPQVQLSHTCTSRASFIVLPRQGEGVTLSSFANGT